MSRSLEGCNTVLDDNPERWLITFSLIPLDRERGVLTRTLIIETEPSLWWRSEKWQENERMYVGDGEKVGEVKDIPLYEMCVILNIHYIGS